MSDSGYRSTRPPHQRQASTDAMAPNPTAVIPPKICNTVRSPASSTSALPISRAEHGQNEQHAEDGAPGSLIHCRPLDTGYVDHHSIQSA
jgi:hypothetical protein